MTNRIIIALLAVLIVGGFVYYQEFYPKPKPTKYFDRTISHKTNTYRPYDTKFFYQIIKQKKQKNFAENELALNDANTKIKGRKNVLIIASPYFLPLKAEVKKMITFAHNGNTIFISSYSYAAIFLNSILLQPGDKSKYTDQINFPPSLEKDSLRLFWAEKDSNSPSTQFEYTYPGENPINYLGSMSDTLNKNKVIVKDNYDQNVMIDLPIGNGHIFLNFCPISLSNYFLLHKQNYTYANRILNKMDFKNRTIIWDKFYEKHQVQRPEPPDETQTGDSYFWQVINQYPTLKWAIMVFFLALGLFILLYSRRLQDPIKILPEVENNSMAFVKALSGLYWLKQDHKKIAEKIIYQFHEHLLVSFRINQKDINLNNVEKIAQKTTINQKDLEEIIKMSNEIESAGSVSKNYLISLYSKVYPIVNSSIH